MARKNRTGEMFSHISEVGIIKPLQGGGTSTLSSDAAMGQKVLAAVSATNFVANDLVIINDAEMMEVGIVGSVLTNNITLKSNLYRGHLSGAAVVEGTRIKLGDVTDDGIDVTLAEGDFNAITAATRRLTAGYLIGHIAQLVSFQIINTNPENFAAALSIPEAKVVGSGSEADPHILDVDPELMGTALIHPWYFKGAKKDGTLVEYQLWGVEVDPTGIGAIKYARGAPAPIPFSLRPTAGIRYIEYK